MSNPRDIPTAGKPYVIVTGQPYGGQTNVRDFPGEGEEPSVHL